MGDPFGSNVSDPFGIGATEDGTETGAAEMLLDDGGSDTIRFAADIDEQNLYLINNLDGSLVIDYSAPGQPLDRLLIDHGLSGLIEKYKVGAGATARTLSDTQFIGEFGNGFYSGTDAANHLHLTGGKTADSIYATGDAIVSGGRGNDDLQLAIRGDTSAQRLQDYFTHGVVQTESRRWRHGEWRLRAANNNERRRSA